MLRQMLSASIMLAASVAFSQPPPKHWESIAYNERSKELAVFSGSEYVSNRSFPTDSLWIFNGKWKVLDDHSIPARWAHALTFHAGALYTYGGLMWDAQNKEAMLNDLWVHAGTWHKLAEGPVLHRPFLYSSGRRLLLAGQSAESPQRFEVWLFDGKRFNLTDTLHTDINYATFHILPAEKGYALVYSTDSGLVFKNMSTGVTNVVKNMPKRSKYGLAYSKKEKAYFLFGGLDAKRSFLGELWLIRNGVAQKMDASGGPSARASSHMVAAGQQVLVYGGVTGNGKVLNELWRYQNGAWVQEAY